MKTRNYADVIRAKLEADPELAKEVDICQRISEAVMEAYDEFKDDLLAARIEGAKAMQEACSRLCLIEHEDPGDTIDVVLDRLGDAIAAINPAKVGGAKCLAIRGNS